MKSLNPTPRVPSINSQPKDYISVSGSKLVASSPVEDQGAFYQLLSKYAPLFMAALKGDWKSAETFFENHPQAIGEPITETMETVLHIAAGTEHIEFVENLAMRMNIDQLRKRNWGGDTALCFVAASGVIEIAKAIINRDQQLRATNSCGELDERLPCKELDSSLFIATTRGNKEMVRYLYYKTIEAINFYNKNNKEESRYEVDYTNLFVAALASGLYDFARELLERHPDIAAHQVKLLQDLDMAELLQRLDDIVDEDQPDSVKAVVLGKRLNDTTAFHVLASKPKAYYSGSRLNLFQKLLYQCLPVNVNEGFLTPARQSLGDKLFEALLHLVPGQQHVRDEKKMHAIVIELLEALSRKTLSSRNTVIGSCIPILFELLFAAAESGIMEFLVVLIRLNPDFLWKVNEDGHTIFHIAVKHRKKKVFRLIDEFGATAIKDFILVLKDNEGNNMLHLAARFPPPNRLKTDSGAAFQLRKELLWFMEIEEMMPPLYREMENHKGETPQSILSKESKELVKEGEEWIKTTSSSCMVVSTLIATVSFAALFTVPGGNDDNSGLPIFRKGFAFKLFAISDSVSLVSSIYSILKFLWILIPRHAVEDFLQAVPNMLAIGLITLFISVATMMAAFGAALFIVIGEDLQWLAITIAVVSGLIVTSFVREQFSFIGDILSDAFDSWKLFRFRKKLF